MNVEHSNKTENPGDNAMRCNAMQAIMEAGEGYPETQEQAADVVSHAPSVLPGLSVVSQQPHHRTVSRLPMACRTLHSAAFGPPHRAVRGCTMW